MTGLTRVRRASLVVLVLVVAEYAIGMYVSLYATIPRAEHGQGMGTAISNGPVMLSIHAVAGLLLQRPAARASASSAWPARVPTRSAAGIRSVMRSIASLTHTGVGGSSPRSTPSW